MTNIKKLEIARQSVKDFLNKKEKGYIPEVDFVKRLLESKKFEFSELGCNLTDEDILHLSKEINSEEMVSIPKVSTIISKEKKPWLHTLVNPSTSYSDRYRKYLVSHEGFSRLVIDKIFDTTDEILDFMANPNSEEECIKKGLVMGNVQSGKTANYLALINKAADVGYKLIILIAGIHNNLRMQTQSRVDYGFIGFDRTENIEVGVSFYGSEKRPYSFTNTKYDFNKNTANSFNFNPEHSNVPVILVIKKNSSTLKNLLEWLDTNKKKNTYSNYPLLLIDDEADNASINTKKHPNEATTINRQIREILQKFKVRSYVGYTATPFANIFINPESDQDTFGTDLFPEDFIVSLETPTSYIGAVKIFGSKNNVLKSFTDNEEYLNAKLKKDDVVSKLPNSLYEAINVYLLTIGIKKIRKIKNPHTSMLINISFRIEIQNQVKDLVEDYIKTIKNFIRYNYKKPISEIIEIEALKLLYDSWKKEFSNINIEFKDLLEQLNNNEQLIKVFLINSKKSNDEKLNYDNYKNEGLNAITIGGYSLSRGFTIEGLSVSYIIRNSQMYDTLLQMGRWFGYRNGYEDLCRIYMRPEAINWYKHITEATEELKEEFDVMNDHQLTPRDYGLKVRNHDESLIITAKNKMYHSSDAIISINYYGELIETRKIINDKKKIEDNLKLLKNLVFQLTSNYQLDEESKKNFLWRNVDIRLVLDFIKTYNNHIQNIKTDGGTIEKYILSQNFTKFDIVIISKEKNDDGETKLSESIIINNELRSSIVEPNTLQISGRNSRVGTISDEKVGLPDYELSELKENLKGKSISGVDYRRIRRIPLLIIHILRIKESKDNNSEEDIFPEGLESVVAYGISFPGFSTNNKRINAVTYRVNKTWLMNNSDLEDENDEEDEDE